MPVFVSILNNSNSRVVPSFCFKARLNAKPLLIGNDFYSHANKTNLHKKGLALAPRFESESFGNRKWPIVSTEGPSEY